MEKIRLNILGISINQQEARAYTMVLAEADGERRIPIIIGELEAQAILMNLEELAPPRPLTHDTFTSTCFNFGIYLRKVEIYKVEAGIFYSRMHFRRLAENEAQDEVIESRTSDAIAMAIRSLDCPIYTNEEVMKIAGFTIKKTPIGKDDNKLELYPSSELKKMMKVAARNEDYEKASLIRDELKKRNEKNN